MQMIHKGHVFTLRLKPSKKTLRHYSSSNYIAHLRFIYREFKFYLSLKAYCFLVGSPTLREPRGRKMHKALVV